MGGFHGLVVSMLLVVAVAERHPIERFRRAGFGVAAVHWLGRVIFGLVVGIVAGNVLL